MLNAVGLQVAKVHVLVMVVLAALALLWAGAKLERELRKRQLHVIDLGETADGDRG